MENICNGHNGAVRIPCDGCSLSNQPIEDKIETHSVCDKRLKKEGGKSLCCECNPHDDCGEIPIEEQWKIAEDDIIDKVQNCVYGLNLNVGGKEYNEILRQIKSSGWLRGEIQRVFENLLEQERKRVSDEVEKLKRYNSHIGIGGLHSADMQIVHNEAIDEALSIINK